MLKSLILLLIGIPVFLVATYFSYTNFQKYEPKILKQIEEVRGIKDENQLLVPYPKGSQKIGFNRTSEGEEVTFQTNLNLRQIQDFYKNVFHGNDWEMESETNGESFLITEFKNKYSLVSIQATLQPNFSVTIVTIKVSNR